MGRANRTSGGHKVSSNRGSVSTGTVFDIVLLVIDLVLFIVDLIMSRKEKDDLEEE